MRAPETTTDKSPIALLSEPEREKRRILVIEPDASRRSQVASGLQALGYCAEAFGAVDDVPWSSAGRWTLVLTGMALPEHELARLNHHLEALDDERPPVRSFASLYSDDGSVGADHVSARKHLPQTLSESQSWSEEFRIKLLRWVADEGSATLRPEACPEAPVGHAYRRLEQHFGMRPGEAVRVLEDLADFGALARRLSNRVHLCPSCRRWTINFLETCASCSSLDVDVEGMIHHFACAYVGLDSEFRHGTELQCPKCGKRLKHIGLDYERPRQTYVCHACDQIFEEPTVTAQCLDCCWEGTSGDVLVWSVYEYELTARGHEAIERGELRGLKLREMIRTSRYELASREFFDLEVERETFRLRRYARPMSILVCRFLVDGVPYALFREIAQETLQAFASLIVATVRSLDIAAMVDATSIAILLPETNESQAKKALARLRGHLDSVEIKTTSGQPVERHWIMRSWSRGPVNEDETLIWFQQQLELQHEEG